MVAQSQRLAQVLQSKGGLRKLVVSKEVVDAPGGEDKVVVLERTVFRLDLLRIQVNPSHASHPNVDVRNPAKHGAGRTRDLGRIEQRRGDLVEQGREEVVIVPVYEDGIDVRALEAAHHLETAETRAHHQDAPSRESFRCAQSVKSRRCLSTGD